jgi:GNAT superfamily N-acetyltransferase
MNNPTPGELPNNVTVTPLHIPASVEDADAADFIEMVRVRNEVYREISGNDDEAMAPAEILPHYGEDPDEIRLIWVIRVGDQIIGRAGIDFPLEEGSNVGYWLVEILRDFHGQGIGSAAYAVVEQAARDQGRTVLQSWAEHPDAPGPRLASPTGFGEIPNDHAARFYQRHGYTLEQVERKSTFDLTGDLTLVKELLAQAQAASEGYRVAHWTLPTPAEYVDGFAWAKSRMSTDAPAAALEFDEQIWDAERVARSDQRHIEAGATFWVTAAIHEASGTVAAFNELCIYSDPEATTAQEDTLVLKEHRGHRLGLLIKAAGILNWREIAPRSPKILTYNAEENRPMLEINEQLGFVPSAYIGAWKKVLT